MILLLRHVLRWLLGAFRFRADPRAPEYEQAMLNAIQQNIGKANSVLVLCGECHRQNISEALLRNGWNVESRDFDWVLQQH
jgi:hypothetical protein